MAHSVNCKLLQSYRQWHSFQNQYPDTECRKLRVSCSTGAAHHAPARMHTFQHHQIALVVTAPPATGETGHGTPATVSTRRALLQTGSAMLGEVLVVQHQTDVPMPSPYRF